MFLTLMVIGLVGLALMAIPAFGRHGGHGHAIGGGHGAHGALHGASHAAHALPSAVAHGVALTTSAAAKAQVPAEIVHNDGLMRFVPSPRAIFSTLALYGAFGNALVRAGHIPFLIAALVAIVPAYLIERVLIRPVWNLAFRSSSAPSSAFEALAMCEARALTSFANGKGLIETVRDGRTIQLSARLCEDQRTIAVPVGTRLLIEDVDAAKERVTVSVLPTSPT